MFHKIPNDPFYKRPSDMSAIVGRPPLNKKRQCNYATSHRQCLNHIIHFIESHHRLTGVTDLTVS